MSPFKLYDNWNEIKLYEGVVCDAYVLGLPGAKVYKDSDHYSFVYHQVRDFGTFQIQFLDYRFTHTTRLHYYPEEDWFVFFYGKSGELQYSLFSTERHLLKEGFCNLAFIPAGTKYSLYLSRDKYVGQIALFFSKSLFFEIFGNYTEAWAFLHRTKNGDEAFLNSNRGIRLSLYATDLIVSLIENYTATANNYYQSLQTLRKLFEAIFRIKGIKTKYNYSFEEIEEIHSLPSIIDSMVEDKIAHKELYNQIYVYHGKINEAFELLYHQLPEEMLEKKRLEAALKLMQKGVKFPSAASRTGFSDSDEFQRTFRKVFKQQLLLNDRD